MADKGIKLTVDGFKNFNAELEKFLDLSGNVSSKLDSIARSFKGMSESLDVNKLDVNIKRLSDAFKSFDNIKLTDNSFFKVINDLTVKSVGLKKLSDGLQDINFIKFRDNIKILYQGVKYFSKINETLLNSKILQVNKLDITTYKTKLKSFGEMLNFIKALTDIEINKRNLTEIFEIFTNLNTIFLNTSKVKDIKFSDVNYIKNLKNLTSLYSEIQKSISESNFSPEDQNKTFAFSNSLLSIFRVFDELSKLTFNAESISKITDSMDNIKKFIYSFTGKSKNERISATIDNAKKNLVEERDFFQFAKTALSDFNPEGIFELFGKFKQSDLNKAIGFINGISLFFDSFSKLSKNQLNEDNILKNINTFNTISKKIAGESTTEKISSYLGTFNDNIKSFGDIKVGLSKLYDNFKSSPIEFLKKNVFGDKGVLGIFNNSSFISKFSNFSGKQVSSLKGVSSFIAIFTKAISDLSKLQQLNIDFAKISFIFKNLQEIFVGKNLFEEILGTFSYASKNSAQIKNNPFDFILSSFNKFLPFITKSNGIFNAFSKFDESAVQNFSRFSRSIIHIFNAFEVLSKASFSPDLVIENLRNINKAFEFFTGGGGISSFFSKGIISKFTGGKNLDSFSKFADALLKITQSFALVSKYSIDESGIRSLVDSIKYFVNELKNIDLGKMSGAGFGNLSKLASSLTFFINKNSSKKQGSNFAEEFVSGVNEELEIKSPSKVFLRIGGFIVQGLGLGLKGLRFAFVESFKVIKNNKMIFAGLLTASLVYLTVQVTKQAIKLGLLISKGIYEGFKLGIKTIQKLALGLSGLGSIGKSITDKIYSGFKGLGKLGGSARELFGSFNNYLVSPMINATKKLFNVVGGLWSKLFSRMSSSTEIESKNIFEKFSDLAFRINNLMSFGNNLGFLKAPINNSVTFESQMADVFKTISMDDLGADQAKAFMAGFTRDIEQLATSRGSTVSGMSDAFGQLTSIAVQAGSAGIAKEFMIDFVKTIGDLSQATDLSSDSAGSSLASFATVTNTTEYSRLGSTLVALGNKFNATESKIMEFAERMSGVAVGTKFTQANILALSSAMASVGINAEAGGTSMTQLIDKITKAVGTGSGLNYFVKTSKMKADEFKSAWEDEPIKVIQSLIDGFSEMTSTEMVRAFDSMGLEGIRLSDMIRRLAGSEGLLADSVNTANQGWEENTALTIEAEKRNMTARSAIERVKNSFFLLGKTLGDFVLPYLVKISDIISGVAVGFSNLIIKLKPTITLMLPTIIKFLGYLTFGLTTSFSLVALLTNAFGIFSATLIGSFGLLFKFFKLFMSPMNLLVGFITFKLLPEFLSKTNKEGKKTLEVFGDLFRSVGKLLNSVFNLGISVGDLVGGFFNFRAETTALQDSPFLNFLTNVTDKFMSIVSAINNAIEKITFFKNLLTGGFGDTTTPTTPSTRDYEVKPGDTLYDLASTFGVSVDDLVKTNDIKNKRLIIAGATLKIPIIPVNAAGEPIINPTDVMGTSSNPFLALEEMQNTDMFRTMFGDDSGALERVKKSLMVVQENITLAKDAGRDFLGSLRQFSSGDIVGGLESVKNGVAGIVGAILGITGGTDYKAQLSGGLEGVDGGLIGKRMATRTTNESNPFLTKIRNYILELRTMDLSDTIKTLSDTFKVLFTNALDGFLNSDFVDTFKTSLSSIVTNNKLSDLGFDVKGSSLETGLKLGFDTLITGALTSVIGAPGYFITGFAKALENDFMGLKTKLQESNIGTIIVGAFEFLNEQIENAFNSILSFGNNKINGKKQKGMGFAMDFMGTVPKDSGGLSGLLKTLDSLFKPIIDIFNMFSGKGGQDAKDGLDNLFKSIQSFASPAITGVGDFFKTIGESLKSFLEYAGTEEGKRTIQETGTTLGNFFSGLLEFGGKSLESFMSFAQNILPALNTFFSGISAFVKSASEGNLSGIGTSVVTMVEGIKNAVGGITVAGLDLLINFFEVITGKELPDSQNFILKAVDAAQLLVDKFEQMLLNAQLLFAIMSTDQTTITSVTKKIIGNDAARQFQDQFMVQSDYKFNPKQMINVRGFSRTVQDMITDPIMKAEFFDSLSGRAREKFINSLNSSLSSGTSINELLPFYQGIFGDTATIDSIFNYIFANSTTEEKINKLKMKILEPFSKLFVSPKDAIGNDVNTGIFGGIKTFIQNIGNLSNTNDGTMPDSAVYAQSLVDNLNKEFSTPDMLTSLGIVGGSISGGLSEGMMNYLDVKPYSNSIIDGVKEQLGIHSPSTEFIKIGQSVGDGFAKGIDNRMNKVKETFTKILDAMLTSFTVFSLSFSILTIPILLSTQSMILNFNNFNTSVVTLLNNINNLGTALAAFGLMKYTPIPIYKAEQRKYGGKINSGQPYQILEDGLPYETYKTKSGKTYFIGQEDGYMNSPLNNKYKPDNIDSGNGYYYNNVQNTSYNVPITFENVPTDMSDENLNRISKTIGNKIKKELEGNNTNKLQEKLRRRGLR